jgi:catechol 2,3-dioxygenase-like lactoylglutathione lyase family enzyme
MKANLHHIDIRVSRFRKSLKFYRDFFRCLGWKKIYQGKDFCGWGSSGIQVWIGETERVYAKIRFHRKRTGLNHIAFRAGSRKEVDAFYKNFLKKREIPILYGGPKEYPEYEKGYYAVFFEDPDRIKLEIVYLPRKKQ